MNLNRIPNTNCSHCGALVYRRPSELAKKKPFCSQACFHSARHNNRAFDYKASESKRLRIKLMQERGVVCELCNYANVNVLQVHHIKRRSDGGTNDMSNLQLLCPNCHATIHLGDSRIATTSRKSPWEKHEKTQTKLSYAISVR